MNYGRCAAANASQEQASGADTVGCSAGRATGAGYLGWLRDQGVERVTVHHIAALSHRRVRDVEFLLACEGIAIDFRLRTVSVADLLRAWPTSATSNSPQAVAPKENS